jgi:hypothetical protein
MSYSIGDYEIKFSISTNNEWEIETDNGWCAYKGTSDLKKLDFVTNYCDYLREMSCKMEVVANGDNLLLRMPVPYSDEFEEVELKVVSRDEFKRIELMVEQKIAELKRPSSEFRAIKMVYDQILFKHRVSVSNKTDFNKLSAHFNTSYHIYAGGKKDCFYISSDDSMADLLKKMLSIGFAATKIIQLENAAIIEYEIKKFNVVYLPNCAEELFTYTIESIKRMIVVQGQTANTKFVVYG